MHLGMSPQTNDKNTESYFVHLCLLFHTNKPASKHVYTPSDQGMSILLEGARGVSIARRFWRTAEKAREGLRVQ
jgi:hypothetical protein